MSKSVGQTGYDLVDGREMYGEINREGTARTRRTDQSGTDEIEADRAGRTTTKAPRRKP